MLQAEVTDRELSFAHKMSLQTLHFCGFAKAELAKLAKMVAAMHEADQAYSIRRTW